ncbi:MAG: AtpZ/AtpI family protein [Leptospiraceae bacterium]|nr:AtpZ/AtpI family protein [Leptospiraceae bacterium]
MDEEKFRAQIEELRHQEKKVRQKIGSEKAVDDTQQSSRSRAMRYTWLGAEFAAIFFAFVYGGNWLDGRLGTKPWLVLVGIITGFSIALYRLIFVARKLSE